MSNSPVSHRPTFFITAWLLAGCSLTQYQSEFECGVPKGAGGCRSLQQIYTQSAVPTLLPPTPDPTRLGQPLPTEEWSPPVKTVWIAPYVDTAGRRHEASLMRLIIFPGAKVVNAEPEFLIPPIPETTEQGELTAPAAPPDLPRPTLPSPREPSRSRATPRPGGSNPLPPDLFAPPSAAPATPPSGFNPPWQ